jgi:hypothetical protein
MDAAVRHWLTLQVDDHGHTATHGMGQSIAQRLTLLYADDSLLGARNSTWLESAAQSLVDILGRLGLEANTTKTKAMTCLPGSIRTSLTDAAYNRRVTGEGMTHRQRQQMKTNCPQCGKELSQSSLLTHLRQQHGMEPDPSWNINNVVAAQLPPQLYTVSFPAHSPSVECPVGSCHATLTTRTGLRTHFQRRHWNDSVHIQEESLAPWPKCHKCGLQTAVLNNRHYNSVTCQQGTARAVQRAAELRAFEAEATSFQLNNTTLDKVRTYLYLGRILAYNNSDWPTVYRNLKKAHARWAQIVRVLDKEGASPRAKGFFYKTIVQSVLLYGCETWTVTGSMLRVLSSFHHRVARRITDMMPRKTNGEWHYPPLDKALREAGLHSMEHYIAVRHNRMARLFAERPIYTQCLAAEPRRGSAPNISRYWKQTWQTDPPDDDDSDFDPDSNDSSDGSNTGSENAYVTDDTDSNGDREDLEEGENDNESSSSSISW